MRTFIRSRYGSILVRLLAVMALFTLCRASFVLFNFGYFREAGPGELLRLHLAGIRFDASAVGLLCLPYLLFELLPLPVHHHRIYRWLKAISFFIPFLAGLAANCGDIEYFRYTARRSTAEVFTTMSTGGDFSRLLPQFVTDFWYVFLLWAIFSALLIFVYAKTVHTHDAVQWKWHRYLTGTVILAAALAAAIVTGRGGVQLRPVSMITAGEYTTAQFTPVVLNTPFCILLTYGKQGLEDVSYFSDAELDKLYSPLHHYRNGTGKMKKYNVVIIILEGFSREHSGMLNPGLENNTYRGYTPFLDSLSSMSLYCSVAYANCKKSIEAIPAVLAGIPALMNTPYITSVYSGNRIRALPTLLREQGYTSAFMHGGTNGTMRFDAFARMAGFDTYLGRTEYANEADFDGKWGIFDEAFLQYAVKEMDKMKPPFLTAIFTLSSHHPYTIPAKYSGKFRKGTLPVHESISYADYSLMKFFEAAASRPWFDSTLFVITADHTPEAHYPEYLTQAGIYAIPMVFYMPGSSLRGRLTHTVQQTDIMPSVLDYLDYNGDFIAYGNSIFDTTSTHFSVSFLGGLYQIISNGYALQYDGNTVRSLYCLNNDLLMTQNVAATEPDRKEQMERKLKAIIQSFNTRVRNNRLTAGE